jgi:hypothetical protein
MRRSAASEARRTCGIVIPQATQQTVRIGHRAHFGQSLGGSAAQSHARLLDVPERLGTRDKGFGGAGRRHAEHDRRDGATPDKDAQMHGALLVD